MTDHTPHMQAAIAEAEPIITVNNDFTAGPQADGKIYAWPNITVLGDVSNLGGTVHLETNPAGEGSIIIKAKVEADKLEIISGGTVDAPVGPPSDSALARSARDLGQHH